jgi:hypothetical protein
VISEAKIKNYLLPERTKKTIMLLLSPLLHSPAFRKAPVFLFTKFKHRIKPIRPEKLIFVENVKSTTNDNYKLHR